MLAQMDRSETERASGSRYWRISSNTYSRDFCSESFCVYRREYQTPHLRMRTPCLNPNSWTLFF